MNQSGAIENSKFIRLNFFQPGLERSQRSLFMVETHGCNLTQPPTMVGQTCRFAPISPPASAAMLAEPWGYARKNIAPLVLVEV
jgi:hypothetical protein